jgi:hypothetical protein
MFLTMRSTLASSSSKNCSKEEADASTSIARGWWWPAGADQGLVAVSLPGLQGRSDETDAMTSAGRRLTTITFRGRDGADSPSKSALGSDDAQAPESWVISWENTGVTIAAI